MSDLKYEPRYIFSYCGSASIRANTTWHEHATWQIEFIISGNARIQFDGQRETATDGDVVLIPPRIPHQFHYEDKETRYTTIHFDLPEIAHHNGVLWLPSTNVVEVFRTAVMALIKPGRNLLRQEAAALEVILQGFIGKYFETTESVEPTHAIDVVEKAKSFIHMHCHKPLTVREVAEHVGYSSNHLSVLFKTVENTSTKQFIDRTRAQLIQRYLVHSDLAISDIASHLGFNDLYAFSRFFKHQCTICPRQFRKRKVTLLDSSFARGK